MRSDAPWTDEQVKALNDWQNNGNVHPFTCGNDRMDVEHQAYQRRHPDQDYGQLVATKTGWYCPVCHYTQSWCHDFMLGEQK